MKIKNYKIINIFMILSLIFCGVPFLEDMTVNNVKYIVQGYDPDLMESKQELQIAQKNLQEHQANKNKYIKDFKKDWLRTYYPQGDATSGVEKSAQEFAEKSYADLERDLQKKVDECQAAYDQLRGKTITESSGNSTGNTQNNASNDKSENNSSEKDTNSDSTSNNTSHNDVRHSGDLWGTSEEGGNASKTYAENVAGRKPSDPIIDLGDGSGEAANIAYSCNLYTKELNGEELPQRDILIYEKSDQTLSWSSSLYNELTSEQKREFMAFALKLTNTSGMNPLPKSNMATFIKQRDQITANAVAMLTQDYNGDLTSANQILKQTGITNFISWIIGIMCLAIAMFMMLSIVFDIVYLSVPTLRMSIDAIVNSNNRIIQGTKPKLVSDDALEALYECEKRNQGNVWTIWLGKKVLTLLFICLVLVAVVSGRIFTLIGIIIDFVELIMHVFGF